MKAKSDLYRPIWSEVLIAAIVVASLLFICVDAFAQNPAPTPMVTLPATSPWAPPAPIPGNAPMSWIEAGGGRVMTYSHGQGISTIGQILRTAENAGPGFVPVFGTASQLAAAIARGTNLILGLIGITSTANAGASFGAATGFNLGATPLGGNYGIPVGITSSGDVVRLPSNYGGWQSDVGRYTGQFSQSSGTVIGFGGSGSPSVGRIPSLEGISKSGESRKIERYEGSDVRPSKAVMP